MGLNLRDVFCKKGQIAQLEVIFTLAKELIAHLKVMNGINPDVLRV